jgi:anti-sigma factor RsiW
MSENELISGTMVQPDAHDEAYVLMSLALDGLLDGEDDARLQALLKDDAALAETWQQWQKLDTLFGDVARAVPAEGFVARFEKHLDERERREVVQRRLLIGATATLAWIITLAVLAVLSWQLVVNQTQWMNDFVRELVYYPSAVTIWWRAVLSSFSATVSEPQSLALATAYAASAMVLLYVWLRLLRRTTREEVAS